MRKETTFDAEFLISPQWVLSIIVAIGCFIALGAEFFFLPWAITSKSMALVIVLTPMTLCGLFLLNHMPWVGRCSASP